MRLNTGAAFALLAMALGLGCGDDGVRLGVERIPSGKLVRSETDIRFDDAALTISAKGKDLKGTMGMVQKEVTETEYLEVKDGQAQKVRITYIMEKTDTTVSMLGDTKEEAERSALDGKSVIGTLNNGVWSFALESGAPDKKEKKALDELADTFGVSVYPKRALQPGESWSLDPTTFRKLFGADWLKAEGNMNMTLESVTEYEGEEAALIRTSFEVRGEDAEGKVMEMGGTGLVYHSLETGLDMYAAQEGQMKLTFEQEEQGIKMRFQAAGGMSETLSNKLR